MKFLEITCRQSSMLLMQDAEEPNSLFAQWQLSRHLLICSACRCFSGNLTLMKKATAQWRKESLEHEYPTTSQ
ncbi:hypothetical protein [Roseateles sp.]|uniref:hypothetical protein n=1 Tax=Roseateles sp. TaxID=1971397 RepID=UPI003D126FF4